MAACSVCREVALREDAASCQSGRTAASGAAEDGEEGRLLPGSRSDGAGSSGGGARSTSSGGGKGGGGSGDRGCWLRFVDSWYFPQCVLLAAQVGSLKVGSVSASTKQSALLTAFSTTLLSLT